MKNFSMLLMALCTVTVKAQNYQEWKSSQQASYQVYQQSYLDRYTAYKQEIEKKWGDYTKLSGAQEHVIYKDNLNQRVVLDYQDNQIIIESLTGEELDVLAALTELASTSVEEALAKDPVLTNVGGVVEKQSLLETLAGSNDVKTVLDDVVVTKKTLPIKVKNNVATQQIDQVKISLPSDWIVKRAEPYFTSASDMSKEYNIDRNLILAIIQTESSFNPLAQSPIPAFGLMQIVPNSAGKDVNMHLNHKDESPKVDTLFKPKQNIRFGAGYLHILDSRYLKGIKNDRSRLFCMIAAYNTGAGNVASVFHPEKKRSLGGAVAKINQLSPDQVYQKLIANLPYQETRTYLKKVNTALEQYKKLAW